jgi:hypothetical protein
MHHGKLGCSTSGMGQKQTSTAQTVMSALPPKADIRPRDQDVCGPRADSCSAAILSLFDQLVGELLELPRHF